MDSEGTKYDELKFDDYPYKLVLEKRVSRTSLDCSVKFEITENKLFSFCILRCYCGSFEVGIIILS